jgi:hypothetical protein
LPLPQLGDSGRSSWRTSGPACDINHDDHVDGTDLTFLLSRWGQGAP